MISKINYRMLIPYFICTTSCLFVAIMNSTIVEQILVLNEAPTLILYKVHYYNILGYVVASLALFICNSYANFERIVIFTLLAYIVSTFNIGFFEFSGIIQKIYPMIYSGSNLIIITSLLYYTFNNKNLNQEYLFCFSILNWFIAYFLAHFILSYKSFKVIVVDIFSIRELIIINLISIIIFFGSFVSNHYFHSSKQKITNSLIVLKNIDLELLSSFTVFYIIMAIFYDYEIYEFTDTLLTIIVSEIKYYIFISILFTSIISSKFVFQKNHHKVNILCIITLIFTFLLTPYWNSNLILSTFCWFIISMTLYLYFWSNLSILAQKFKDSHLQLGITLYMLSASIGYYCSYVIMSNIKSVNNEYNLVTTICSVLFFLLIYYFYRYKKYNLAKW